ncbi:MAG: translocation/assembly module TamB domain-containing protein [Geminicoccaceae bacterium]
MLARISKIVGLVLAAMLVLFGGAFAFAQTETGKAAISNMVGSAMSGPEQTAQLTGLAGLLPFNVRLGSFTLSDAEGTWLSVDGARVRLSPASLLGGRIRIEDVGAQRVSVARLPPSAPPPERKEPFSLPSLPELPASLPPVQVDRLLIESIELKQPVLGEAATFKLEGKGGTGETGRDAALDLALTRTDQPTASLTLNAGLDLAAKSLRLDAKGDETGGLIAALTGKPEVGAFHLDLGGNGALDDWKGKLAATAVNGFDLQTDLNLAYAAAKRVALTGSLTTAPGFLPADLQTALGSRVDLALKAQETGPGAFALDDLRIDLAAANLSGKGTVDLQASKLYGGIDLSVPDLSKLAGLAGVPLAGSTQVAIRGSGSPSSPAVDASLSAQSLKADTATIGKVDGKFAVAFLAPLDQGYRGVDVTGGLVASPIAVDGNPLGGDQGLRVDLDAHVPKEGQAELRQATITSTFAQAKATGRLDMTSLAGNAELTADVPSLGDLVRALPVAVDATTVPQGGASLQANATIAEKLSRIDGDISFAGRDLRGLPAGTDALVGPAPKLTTSLSVEPGKSIVAQDLRLDAAGFSVTGNPQLGLGDQSLGGSIQLVAPDLSKLSDVAKTPLAGALTVDAALSGTGAAPGIDLRANAARLVVADRPFDAATLQAKMAGPIDTTGGDIRLAVTQAGQDLSLASGVKRNGSTVALNGLALEGPGTRVAGGVSVDTARLLATGKLAGGVKDLAALEPWVGQKLTGSVDLQADLATPGDRQNASVTLGGQNVAGDFGKIGSVAAQAEVNDALGKVPGITSQASIEGLATPSIVLDSGTLGANGTLAGLDVTAKAEGSQGGQPFALDAGARIEAAGPTKTAVISKLSGKLAGQNVQLGQPATLKLEAGVLDIDRIDLRVAGGQVQGSLSVGDPRRADLAFPERPLSGQVRADLDLAKLASLASIANQEIKGKLNADMRVDGRVGQPLLNGTASISKGLVADAVTGAVLRDLTVRVVANGPRIEVQQLAAKGTGKGTLSGTGAVTLAEAGPTGSVSLTFAGLQVLDNEFGTARISGPLEIAMAREALSIDSKGLTVDRADLEIPSNTGASIPNLPVTMVNFPGSDGEPRRPTPALPVRLDVSILMPGKVFLRGRGLDSEWGGDLRVQGTAAAPRIVGDIHFRRGLMDLLGRRFNIQRGTIRFTGSNPPEPWVDLVASATAADVTAVVALRGIVTDPKLTLSSQPPLPQDEVLSRILFGRSTARITPIQGIQLAAAVQELQGGGGISSVLGAIRKSTGLDTLDFTSTDTPNGETQGAVRAGRYVTDNVYVEGQQGTAPGSGRVRVQVDVTPSVSVTTDLYDSGQTAAGVQWQFDY